MSVVANKSKVWWGRFDLATKKAGRWRVGPSTIRIERREFEWRISHWMEGDPLDSSCDVSIPVAPVDDEESGYAAQHATERYSFEKTEPPLVVHPVLADRPVVVRPETPMYIPRGQTVTLYVSTPLWVRVQVGPDETTLSDIPSYRPSDSWFGPNTRDGELCYATTTLGRLQLEDMPLRLHRAVTPIVVRNNSVDTLEVERIRIPVEYLSLFQDRNGYLWTESIRFDRVHNDELAALNVNRGAPSSADGAIPISDPRETPGRGTLVRAFSSLFQKIIEE